MAPAGRSGRSGLCSGGLGAGAPSSASSLRSLSLSLRSGGERSGGEAATPALGAAAAVAAAAAAAVALPTAPPDDGLGEGAALCCCPCSRISGPRVRVTFSTMAGLSGEGASEPTGAPPARMCRSSCSFSTSACRLQVLL